MSDKIRVGSTEFWKLWWDGTANKIEPDSNKIEQEDKLNIKLKDDKVTITIVDKDVSDLLRKGYENKKFDLCIKLQTDNHNIIIRG